jgi:nucleotidyltransferase substrate binding protein (TIGR01987 family)
MDDIRWKQRFNNFIKAYRELEEAIELAKTKTLSKLEKQGVIQGFEYTHELAWNVLKDYLEEQGHVGLIGSKDTSREAFKRGLIKNGDAWMEMIKSRNLTSHTYDQTLADTVFETILNRFYPEFRDFEKKFTSIDEKDSNA